MCSHGSKYREAPAQLNLPIWETLKSLEQFDDQVTAPLHGFDGAQDYYKKSSSRQYLKSIGIPTLLLQAQDDPFMLPDSIPQIDELSVTVQLEVTKNGGHVGFVSGILPWRPTYWLEQRVPLFLQKYLE